MSRQPRPRRVKIIRYEDAQGRRCAKGAPSARRVEALSETWYVTLRDPATGKPVRESLHTSDEALAWARLRDLQRKRLHGRQGLTDAYTEQAARPLAEHLDDWTAAVAAKGTTDAQVRALRRSVEGLAALAGWTTIADLTESSTLIALAALQREPSDRCPKGRSAQTRNHYLSHTRQFARWLVRNKRLREYPLGDVGPISVQADRRHDRRAPTDEEVRLLFESLAAPDVPSWAGMTGRQRALMYALAMATGFRASELRSLSRESFDLDVGTVTAAAGYSKRRRQDKQHLPAWLVDQLREWFEAGGAVWSTLPRWHPGEILIRDLQRAGIPYSVPGPDGPLFFDFHSLRHWFCSWAANLPGISPRTLLALTRHSSVDLAMRIYAKARQGDIKAAADQLPQLGMKPPSG